MENNAQGLREGLNEFEIIGTLKEKELEVKTLKDKQGRDYEAITGELVIKVGEYGEHTVSLFSKKHTKAGAESKLFKAYKTVMDTYISLADIAKLEQKDREGVYPTRLSVRGGFRVNDYYSNNELKSFLRLDGKFINSITDPEVEDKAEFDADIYINSIKPEFDKNGIDTGRLSVVGLIVGYNSIVSPIDFAVTAEEGIADYFTGHFGVGETIQVWGEIVNSAVTKTTTKTGFGKAKEETVTSYNRETLITGGEEFPLTNGQEFDPDLIQKALAEREIYLQEVEQKGKAKSSRPTGAKGFGGGSPSTTQPSRKISPDDIPF